MTVESWKTVQLVDQRGESTGTAEVTEAHTPPPLLHRAFSVLLTDGAGRLLLQRRAWVKARFAGRWSNSCCGHPPPGMGVVDAARMRTQQELGVPPKELRQLATFVYRAGDPETGLVEYEFDHVLLGLVHEPLNPSPIEVDEVRWVSRADWRRLMAAEAFTPWLVPVLDRVGADTWR